MAGIGRIPCFYSPFFLPWLRSAEYSTHRYTSSDFITRQLKRQKMVAEAMLNIRAETGELES